jgi:hypothetical protein
VPMRCSLCPLALMVTLIIASLSTPTAESQASRPAPLPPKTTRLYIFDCGLINVNRAGTERYKVTPEESARRAFRCRASWSSTRRVL